MKLGLLTSFFILLLIAATKSESLEDQVQRLKNENGALRTTIGFLSNGQNCPGNQDRDKILKLEEKISKLETELETCQRQQVNLASCDAVKDLNPSAVSGTFDLDFDGAQGDEPSSVQCNFEDETTTFGKRTRGHVEHCTRPGCYDLPTSYENRGQLAALIDQSDFCQQDIVFDCVRAKLTYGGVSLLKWFDVSGNAHDVSGSFHCNSGSSAGQQDVITIRDKSLLPIKRVSYGPMSDRNQKAKITISPITCSHRKQDLLAVISEKNHRLSYCQMPKSCEDLYDRGFPTGNYLIDFDGVGGLNPVMVFCKFPEMITTIGDQFDDTISNCLGASCHTLTTKWTDNEIGQAKLLIQDPILACSQNLTFHCKSARINFNGDTFLTYRDVSDQSHHVRSQPYGCDLNRATETTDVIEIYEESHLPLSSVSYGPLYQGSQARVSVGPVSCKPENGYLLVAGGYSGGDRFSKVELLDKRGHVKTLPDLPKKMSDLTGGLLMGKVVLCGGYDHRYLDKCYELSDDGSTWNKNFARMSDSRSTAAAIALPGKLWVSGGYNGISRVQSSDFISPNGQVTPGPNLPVKLEGHAVIQVEDSVYVIGGYDGNSRRSNTWIYTLPSLSTNLLKEGPAMNKARRWHGFTSFKSNNHGGRTVIMVAGGDGASKSVEILDVYQPGSTWVEIRDLPIAMNYWPGLHPTDDGVMIIYDDKIYKLWVKDNDYKYEKMSFSLETPRTSFASISIPDSVAKNWI